MSHRCSTNSIDGNLKRGFSKERKCEGELICSHRSIVGFLILLSLVDNCLFSHCILLSLRWRPISTEKPPICLVGFGESPTDFYGRFLEGSLRCSLSLRFLSVRCSSFQPKFCFLSLTVLGL